jgi:uncharacterized SAM-binding protein YcdF (DUF218 family)
MCKCAVILEQIRRRRTILERLIAHTLENAQFIGKVFGVIITTSV